MIKEIDLLKKEQRNLLSKRRGILKNQINVNNDFFFRKLLTCEWFQESKIIASFLSIKSEISTTSLNNFIENQSKILCLPVMVNENNKYLIFKSYSKGDNLVIGNFNVQEPSNVKIYLPDIIFTPCLGFDLKGYRIGYGGGYYDKTISYLYSVGHLFLTVGFAYDDQKVEEVVRDSYDQKLNYILTEKQLYKI